MADLHIRAMTSPLAAGQRYLAAAGAAVTLPEIAATLRERLGEAAARVPVDEATDDEFRAVAAERPELEVFADLLGTPKQVSAAKAVEQLGWHPRPAADAVTATATSLLSR